MAGQLGVNKGSSSRDDQINPNYVIMAEEYETSNLSTSGIRIAEPTDNNMDNLARQGLEDPNRHTPQWKFTLGKHIRDKVYFDMQPTDPQSDISGTGRCELRNRQVDFIRPPPVRETTHDNEQYDTPSQPPAPSRGLANKSHTPKFQTLSKVTCVYGIDDKFSSTITITPQRLSISQDAYNPAHHQYIHALLNLPF